MSAPQLPRAIGVWVAAAIVVGTVIGSGVFKKPTAVAQDVPHFGTAMLAWVLAGTLTVLGGLALAEVTVLFPQAGGNYVFLREAYGRPFGFLWGWVDFTIIRSASIAALAGIGVESLHDFARQLTADPSRPLLGFWALHGLSAAAVAGLAVVNARGVRWGGGVQFALTVVKVGAIAAMAALPFALAALGGPPARLDYLSRPPERDLTLVGFGAALIAVLWPYHGWMNLGPMAEEIREPQRNIPRALLGGIGTVLVLYLGVNVAYACVLSQPELAGLSGTTVAAAFCGRLLGPLGAALAAGAVMASAFGSLNGNLLVGPRMPFAMARDGLAPRRLADVHPTWRTPAVATAALAGWSVALVLGVAVAIRVGWLERGKSHFDVMTDFAMFGAVAFETLAVASIFVFRRTRPDAPRPYRCPGYPVVPALYVAAMLAVLATYFLSPAKRNEAFTGTAFVLAGAAVYAAVLRGRATAGVDGDAGRGGRE